MRIDPKRHRFHTKVSFILTTVTLILFLGLSVLFRNHDDDDNHHLHRWLEDNNANNNNDDDNSNNDEGDYSRYSCRYIYEQVPEPGHAQCQFARTCNGGDGVWASWVFCSPLNLGVFALFLMLSPVMIVWMVALFRLLGSTAEDYFSPSLEMFSLKLGLPPRFAGVTLLALGNGAADVSATMSAIVSDEENGYKLSLGALTGAAMLVGGVVSGIVILVADGVTCRGALVRDVTALAITIVIVWVQLSRGVITPTTISLFLSMYGFFVFIVLVADVYHRAVVLPRLAAAAAEAEAAATEGLTVAPEAYAPNAFMKFVTAFSNYDNPCERDTTVPAHTNGGVEAFGDGNPSENLVAPDGSTGLDAQPNAPAPRSSHFVTPTDEPIVLHGQHGILHGDGQVPPSSFDSTPAPTQTASSNTRSSVSSREIRWNPEDGATGGAYTLVEDHIDQVCIGEGSVGVAAPTWKAAWDDGKQEVKASIENLWEDIAFNGDLKLYEKVLLLCEFPFTLFRKASIPIPCEGYYNRGFIALSMALSPLWFAFYLLGHEINLFSKSLILYFMIYWAIAIVIGASILRLAPGGEGNMSMVAAAPVALYGFVMAATWIDYIADHLVSLLDFIGIVLHIPGTIMGLTVLAWGNSMGDLSANMTMARKGLGNMAMTACFAGPVFNILMGLGLGFSSLEAQTHKQDAAVSLSAPIVTGFIFVLINCGAILVTGTMVGKGRIEPYYGYIALALYTIYVVTSITLELT